MSHEIIVRFPDKNMADEFVGQMMDGWGEGFCDFTQWRQKENTDGTQQSDYEKVVEIDGRRRIYFVNSMNDE